MTKETWKGRGPKHTKDLAQRDTVTAPERPGRPARHVLRLRIPLACGGPVRCLVRVVIRLAARRNDLGRAGERACAKDMANSVSGRQRAGCGRGRLSDSWKRAHAPSARLPSARACAPALACSSRLLMRAGSLRTACLALAAPGRAGDGARVRGAPAAAPGRAGDGAPRRAPTAATGGARGREVAAPPCAAGQPAWPALAPPVPPTRLIRAGVSRSEPVLSSAGPAARPGDGGDDDGGEHPPPASGAAPGSPPPPRRARTARGTMDAHGGAGRPPARHMRPPSTASTHRHPRLLRILDSDRCAPQFVWRATNQTVRASTFCQNRLRVSETLKAEHFQGTLTNTV